MKGVALNLTQSPENLEIWERADPFHSGAGQAASAIETSAKPTPRGPRQHRAVQRQASNQASDEHMRLLGNPPCKQTPEYRAQCKKRVREGHVASDGDRCAAKA